ncbi:HAD family hydrolase [Paenibacillus planticolens]|uniref:Hydrolase n=1 Tax=Paenibacillus planticolens TaxID=2654976 RepID=A0ABX1ZII7_9BACL|nr:HAD family hydrolase [Paenibacillus planticolens]NOU99650.1 hydrolase [Paenibacillus planticolens]
MIFASDLDQTLIYSQPEDRATELGSRILIAELIDGKVRSYMSANSYHRLQSLMKELTFIPVTTRTLKQYDRIHLISQMLQPAYAVTSNGGNIVLNGQPDPEWHRAILARVQDSSVHVEEVRKLMDQVLHSDWVISSTYCDDLFFSHIVERDKIPQLEMRELSEELQRLGWTTSIQGRKVYIVPKAVNKRDAVAHLKQIIGDEKIVASGDSLLDQILLDFADYSLAPRHGELFRQEQLQGTGAYTFTEESGIFATDEIIEYVQAVHNKHNPAFRIKESS